MKKVKSILTFLAIGILLSACEFSPEEIQPLGKVTLENTGVSGTKPIPNDPPPPPDED